MENVYRIFKQTVDKFEMLCPGDRVMLAYSGGTDSSALLGLLLKLRKERPLEICLAHFNHHLRAAAAEEENFVREVARRYKLPLDVGGENVKRFALDHRMNLEEAGRQLRYDFLKSAALRTGSRRIATAHTLTDQTETVLMRLMRGSGPRGLCGIYPLVEGGIIRPLLSLTREDIRVFLKACEMPFRVDESNADRRYLRNRIRLELLPLLREKYDARIESHIDSLTTILRDEETFMDQVAHDKSVGILTRIDGAWNLGISRLEILDVALQRRVVREFLCRIKGDLRGVSLEDVDRILSLREGGAFTFKTGITLERKKGIARRAAPLQENSEYTLFWGGEDALEIESLGMSFVSRIFREIPNPKDYDDLKRAWLDSKKISFPLQVRSRRDGDRYLPLGAPGRRKLKEVMREKGIPLALRNRLPLFISGGEIVWAPGLPVGEAFKIDEETREVVSIEMTDS